MLLHSEPPRYRIVRRIIEWGLLTFIVVLAVIGFVRVAPTLIAIPVQQDFGAYYVAALKPRKLPENAPTSISRVHAVLGCFTFSSQSC